jgi:hypothetical protein
MAYIEVDVDINEFCTNELIDELVHRLRSKNQRLKKQVNKEDIEKVRKAIKVEFVDLPELIGNDSINGFELKTLDDKMKMEHLVQVWSKYTLSQIQYLLP